MSNKIIKIKESCVDEFFDLINKPKDNSRLNKIIKIREERNMKTEIDILKRYIEFNNTYTGFDEEAEEAIKTLESMIERFNILKENPTTATNTIIVKKLYQIAEEITTYAKNKQHLHTDDFISGLDFAHRKIILHAEDEVMKG